MIAIGTTFLAFGINWFTAPSELVTGGVSGIGIIVQSLSARFLGTPIPLWVTNIVLNVPLFAVSIHQRGFEFAKKSLYAVIWLSFSLWYTAFIPDIIQVGDDLLLAGLFGGVLLGTGVGTVLRANASTGGTDMLASILKFRFPEAPIAKLILMIDAIIIASGFFIFGSIKAMYAVIALYVSSKVIGGVLEGTNFAKAAFIISDHSHEIAEVIMEKLPRGATSIPAKGMYSKEAKEMLFVVVGQKQITQLRTLVREVDPKAFVTIADVREVLGEGFVQDVDSLAL